MCFDNRYEWYAHVVEKDTPLADKDMKCQECQVIIPTGERYYHVYMQEYEACAACENGVCECPPVKIGEELEDGCCVCENPDIGETFDYLCCTNCSKFLMAVSAAEEKAGCSGDETRPATTEMIEKIRDAGAHEAKRYWKQAKEMYPELISNGYLPALWRRMFKNYD